MPNNLAQSKSPYLLQHKHNPVNWHEWSAYILRIAQEQNKPLIISIGYSACHWCHVMAHESFEDEATAQIMNEHFINIKIDREEHPDLDAIYMDACQLVTGNGGWPLNAFALPDGSPFHAGTYFKKHQWRNILMQIAKLWKEEPEKVHEYAQQLKQGLQQVGGIVQSKNDAEELQLEDAIHSLSDQWDTTYGGTNRAPKFPMPTLWKFLIRIPEHQQHTLFTLEQMSLGGIYDWVEGGFARYSVDARWFAPHFEKMLYDNAQLVELFTLASRISMNKDYFQIAEDTLEFMRSEWLSNDGGYYSAFDADSEGTEGKYYCLTYPEMESLELPEADLFVKYFQIQKEGNWEHGLNILYPVMSTKQFEQSESIKDFSKLLLQWKSILKENRTIKVKPGLDDKQNTAWNALLLSAISAFARETRSPEHMNWAQSLAEYILYKANDSDGGLMHMRKNRESYLPAYLEDYALCIEAFFNAYELTQEFKYLAQAESWMKHCKENLISEDGLFFKISNHQSINPSKIEVTDNVIPSTNSVMCELLLKLGIVFNHWDWYEHGITMLSKMKSKAIEHPQYYANWCRILYWQNKGFPYAISKKELNSSTRLHYWMNLVYHATNQNPLIIAEKNWPHTSAQYIYICANHQCQSPIDNEKMLKQAHS